MKNDANESRKDDDETKRHLPRNTLALVHLLESASIPLSVAQ